MAEDVEICDSLLPFAVDQFLIFILQAASVFVTIAVIYPIVLVTFPVVFVLVVALAKFLRNGTRQSRRIVGTLRSHVVYGDFV